MSAREQRSNLIVGSQRFGTRGNNEAIDEMLTDTTVIHGLTDTGGVDIKGPAAFREFRQTVFEQHLKVSR